MATRDAEMPGGPPLTREQVLDELDFLARVEHSLCVEYLTIFCALGHNMPPADTGAAARHVQHAAEAALGIATREMRHLHTVNRLLAAAGRPHQLGRASSIQGRSGAEIALGPLSAEQLERLLDREREIASAVDERYARVHAALESQEPPFERELLAQMTFGLPSGPDHSTALSDLEDQLQRVPPEVYLRATRRDPNGELERSLLELNDRHYALVVATVRVWFAHEDQPIDELGGKLPGQAQAFSTMDGLSDVTRLLAERGLLPTFTPPH